jgi:hypothetical protein
MGFLKGDIITWHSVLGDKDFRVVEVYDTLSLPAMLCVAVDGGTGTVSVLQLDATLKERPVGQADKKFTRKEETARPLPVYNNSGRDD